VVTESSCCYCHCKDQPHAACPDAHGLIILNDISCFKYASQH
jgi:hypothetical protein